ncbi:radical SAM protein [Phocaeicola coprocola]|uniref:radical SAM protein n=1 Tax=Phocaeicola coprocola TaxID=310298 RepID=UPI00397BB7BE
MQKINNIIVNPINSDCSIIYAFRNGKFYIIPNHLLYNKGEIVHRKEITVKTDTFKLLVESSYRKNCFNYEIIKSPIVLDLMVSNQCNLKCKYCIAYYGKSYSEKCTILDKDKQTLLTNNIIDSNVVSLLISGGEPTLNPQLPSFLKKISNTAILILLDTNGTIIQDDLMQILREHKVTLRISLDSINKDIHNENRGLFDKTMENLDLFLKNSFDVRINTVLHKENFNQLTAVGNWLVKNKILNWHIFKLQKDFAPQSLWINDDIAYNTIESLKKAFNGRINILCKFSKTNDGFASFVVDSEGNCFSSKKGEKVLFGNLFTESLKEIWANTPLNFRISHCNKYLFNEGCV